MKKFKEHFVDYWGLTGYSFTYIGVIALAILIWSAISLRERSCSNYAELNNLEYTYIVFDACYIKNSDGLFIRDDGNYKSVK